MTPGEFLKNLWAYWPLSTGSVTIWVAPGAESTHVPIAEVRAWTPSDDEELARYAAGKNVYTSPGLRVDGLPSRGPGSQGKQSDVVGLCGFVLDVDLKGGKHAAENLPVTDEDVAALLEVGPDPTIVVDTGGGLHCWWLFSAPWQLPDAHERRRARGGFRAFQDRYIARGEELGFHVDATATIQHVFRLPGTMNCKRAVPVPVEVVYVEGPRHEVSALLEFGDSVSRRSSSSPSTGESHPASAPETDGIDEELDAVREWMRRVHPNHKNRSLIEAALAGESLAEPGERDRAMQRVVSTIAWLTPARSFNASELAELLRPSLAVWAEESGAEKTLEEEIEKATEKFERAIQEREESDQRESARLSPLRRFLRLESTKESADEGTVTNAGLRQFAVIQYKNSFWAQSFGAQTGYLIRPGFRGPFVRDELIVQLQSLWEGGPPQFDLSYVNDDGKEKRKQVVNVVQEYATGAHDVLGHFSLQDSYFDPATRVFHEAICPIRPLEPTYDPLIAEWLELLGGSNAERLLDWIAAVTQLDYQCCALYLAGPPDCGKSLIATGLARLWHVGGATPLADVMKDFNAEMFRCPLINLDEGLPDRKYKNASAFLRSLVGSSTHTYNQKNVVTRKVVGSIRLLISANNDNVLKFSDEELSALDLEAVVGRFLHLRVSDKPAKWIDERNAGRRMTDEWVIGDGIAKHALWLRENRCVDPGRRFLVEGETTDMHRAMVTQGKWNGIVLEWLARCVTDPTRIEHVYASKRATPRVRVGNQKILVNTQAIVDAWDTYLAKNAGSLSTNAVGRVLNQLSDQHKPKIKINGERVHFHQVDPDLVFSWAEENQVGDLEQMHRNLSRAVAEVEEGIAP